MVHDSRVVKQLGFILLAQGRNMFLTWLSNMFTNLNLTDMKLATKFFVKMFWRKLQLRKIVLDLNLRLQQKFLKFALESEFMRSFHIMAELMKKVKNHMERWFPGYICYYKI